MPKWLLTSLVLLLGLGLAYQILNGFLPGLSTQEAGKKGLSAKEELMKQPTFPGIMAVQPKAVKALLKTEVGKPVLLEFYSKFCHDCQKMAPSLEALEKKYPDVLTLKLDVQASDATTRQWMSAFQPQVTPTLVAILPDGTLHTSMVGLHSPAMLQATYDYLRHALPPNEVSSEAVSDSATHPPHHHKSIPL